MKIERCFSARIALAFAVIFELNKTYAHLNQLKVN